MRRPTRRSATRSTSSYLAPWSLPLRGLRAWCRITGRIPQPGYLVINPSSFVRRVTLDLPELAALPAVEKPVYAAVAAGEHKYVVVDIPPMGFAWITGSPSDCPTQTSAPNPRRIASTI